MAYRIPLKTLGIDPKTLIADVKAEKLSVIEANEINRKEVFVDYRAEFQRALDRPDDPRVGFTSAREIRDTGILSDKIAAALGDAIVLENVDYEMLKRKLNLPGVFGVNHRYVRQMLDDVDNAEKVDLNKTKAK